MVPDQIQKRTIPTAPETSKVRVLARRVKSDHWISGEVFKRKSVDKEIEQGKNISTRKLSASLTAGAAQRSRKNVK